MSQGILGMDFHFVQKIYIYIFGGVKHFRGGWNSGGQLLSFFWAYPRWSFLSFRYRKDFFGNILSTFVGGSSFLVPLLCLLLYTIFLAGGRLPQQKLSCRQQSRSLLYLWCLEGNKRCLECVRSMSGKNPYLGVSGWCLDGVWIVYLMCLESVCAPYWVYIDLLYTGNLCQNMRGSRWCLKGVWKI